MTLPIKDLKFLRDDDLVRKLRTDDFFADMRCTPIIYKQGQLNLFIDGTIYDK